MIIDRITNLTDYPNVPYAKEILKFLNDTDLKNLEDGEHEIDGRNLFARVMRFVPQSADQNYFETHREYADVQCVLDGREMMQVVRAEDLTPHTEYDEAGDYQFFTAESDVTDLKFRSGECVVYFPGEPHKPGCELVAGAKSFKIVFKIKV